MNRAGVLMHGTLTGRDPALFGTGDSVFGELGIGSADALMLQRVAHDMLVSAGTLPR